VPSSTAHHSSRESRLVSIRKKNGGDPRLRLMLDGKRLISVRERGQQLMTKRGASATTPSDCGCRSADATTKLP
jgi:hypothetical protein